jgi:hypothetical protein
MTRSTVALIVVLASACFHPNLERPRCGPGRDCPSGLTCSEALICEPLGSDASIPPVAVDATTALDAALDAPPDACATFSAQFDTCELALDVDLRLAGTAIAYNTDTHRFVVDGIEVPVPHLTLATTGVEVDALLAHNLVLVQDTVLRATGSRPFAIVASGSITLERGAMIDVGDGGAGALTVCSSPAEAGTGSTGGGGGGGGGGYSGAGGRGGPGNRDGVAARGGNGAGSVGSRSGPMGGCPGAKGGDGDSPGGTGGAGGGGGGGIYLVAADTLQLGEGAILTAGGGGGAGGGGQIAGGGDAGGGGGGSGGMILLEGLHIVGPQAQIAANGGGGGEGSNSAQPGNPGRPGGTTASPAAGGADGPPEGGDGGRGGALQMQAGEDVTLLVNGGGGGGGGGVGYILVSSPDVQLGTVSPPAVSL